MAKQESLDAQLRRQIRSIKAKKARGEKLSTGEEAVMERIAADDAWPCENWV